MPNTGERNAGIKEHSNYSQGRSGSKCEVKPGPAAGGSKSGNKTMSGGINRATKPTSQE
jgi:hypothetical protein